MPSPHSYWGMNAAQAGEYQGLSGLAGAGKQIYDQRRAELTDLIEQEANAAKERGGFWKMPGLDSLPDAVSGAQQYMTPELREKQEREAYDKALAQLMDAPVTPYGGLGTIVRAPANALLKKAKSMLKAGEHPQAIINETKMYQDRAGNWKTQIPDNKAQIAEHEVRRAKTMTPLDVRKARNEPPRQLANVMKHDELFMERPELAKRAVVKFTDEVGTGAMRPKFDSEGNLMRLEVKVNPEGVRKYARAHNMSYEEAMRTVMLHEVNHGVQVIDRLPGGSNPDWINQVKKEAEGHKKQLNMLKATYRQLPKEAPRAKELKSEIEALDSQVKLLEAAKDVDGDALYRHTLGEADSFWVQSMKDDPNVASKLPSHERPENPTVTMDGNQLPFRAEWANVTDPGRSNYMVQPEAAMKWEQAGSDAVESDIRLGHTSPAWFNKFDLGMAGSGEGAAGFGHGVYAWSDPKVGRHYEEMFADRLRAEAGQAQMKIEALQKKLNQPRGVSNEEAKLMREDIAALREAAKVRKPYNYDVEVDDKYLKQLGDWDNEVRYQSEEVKSAVRDIAKRLYDEPAEAVEKYTIEEVYRDLAKHLGSQEAASAMFKRKGVVGHKFLDGLSRDMQRMRPLVDQFGGDVEAAAREYIKELSKGPLGKIPTNKGVIDTLVKAYKGMSHNYVLYDDTVPVIRGLRDIGE